MKKDGAISKPVIMVSLLISCGPTIVLYSLAERAT